MESDRNKRQAFHSDLHKKSSQLTDLPELFEILREYLLFWQVSATELVLQSQKTKQIEKSAVIASMGKTELYKEA